MKTLELIRRLYDEKIGAASLEDGLSEEDRDELRRIVEAKHAMDDLPKVGPSPEVLETIRDAARQASPPQRSMMTLIASGRFVRRFAAAAAVVAAVGLGYLSVRPTLVETPGELQKSAGILAEQEEVAAAQPEPAARRNEVKEKILLIDSTAYFADRVDMDIERAPGPLDWDDDRRFQTFYWQVQALGERSPYDDLEEAVPLEGSFEVLSRAKRDPGWLEANSEK